MSNDTDIVWGEPPARSNKYRAFLDALRGRPGEWGGLKVDKKTGANSLAWNIRVGRVDGSLPYGSFESTCRAVDGEYWVYARYVGEDQGPEALAEAAREAMTPPHPRAEERA